MRWSVATEPAIAIFTGGTLPEYDLRKVIRSVGGDQVAELRVITVHGGVVDVGHEEG